MPVYSEDESIINIINFFNKNLLDLIVEIIIVYHPKSNLKCINILDKVQKENKHVKLYEQAMKIKGGNGIAYRQGFEKATGTHILMIDSDGEMDVKTTVSMVAEALDKNYDIVIGSRYVKGGGLIGYSYAKSILNPLFHIIFRFLFSTKVRDLTCGYKIIKRDLLKKYNLVGKYQDIAMETTLRPLKDGATIKEVPTVWKRKIGDKNELSIIGNLRYPILALKILFNLV